MLVSISGQMEGNSRRTSRGVGQLQAGCMKQIWPVLTELFIQNLARGCGGQSLSRGLGAPDKGLAPESVKRPWGVAKEILWL